MVAYVAMAISFYLRVFLPLPLKHELLEDRVRLYLSELHQDPLAQGGHLIKLGGMNKHKNKWMGCFHHDLWNAWACGMPD